MLIVGIVGSPRKDGRTHQLVQAALDGAAAAGAETRMVYLVDYDLRPFTGGGGAEDAYTYCAEELSSLCAAADALVVGSPVYWGDISGLTKDWMDTVRLPRSNGKWGLGIAIAGGSGKGLLSGVQSINHWFYHKQMRCLEAAPVSRFNMEATLERLRAQGAELAEMAAERAPFVGETVDEVWIDCTAAYGEVRYMRADPVDEFMMLAQQLVTLGVGDEIEAARDELRRARIKLAEGERAEAGRLAVRCYLRLYH